jgi:hypothetical protein
MPYVNIDAFFSVDLSRHNYVCYIHRGGFESSCHKMDTSFKTFVFNQHQWRTSGNNQFEITWFMIFMLWIKVKWRRIENSGRERYGVFPYLLTSFSKTNFPRVHILSDHRNNTVNSNPKQPHAYAWKLNRKNAVMKRAYIHVRLQILSILSNAKQRVVSTKETILSAVVSSCSLTDHVGFFMIASSCCKKHTSHFTRDC